MESEKQRTGNQPAAHAKPGFDHLVVIMFENRSFDNLLGYLYPPGKVPEGQTFNGVANGNYSNPDHNGNPVKAHIYDKNDLLFSSPQPDPGEEYQHVNTQLFGTVDPPSNAHAHIEDMQPPFNAPPPNPPAQMNGFVKDYINNMNMALDNNRVQNNREPEPDYEVIMGSFSPRCCR